MIEVKTCRCCKGLFPLEYFHNNKEMRDGKSSYCKPCVGIKALAWKKSNADKALDGDLKRKYGISLKEHKDLYESQNGTCAICFVPEEHASRGKLFIDHCHTTGKVRGLLCHSCNSMLGYAQDSETNLNRGIKYLKGEL